MNIILISGKAEAGKTTTANILQSIFEDYGYTVARASYGQYVKDTAKMLYGWNGIKDKAGRQLLQHWGTDVVRKKDPDFWVETVGRLAEMIDGEFDYLIIDDCRFPNEFDYWVTKKRISDPEVWDYEGKNRKWDFRWTNIYLFRVERPGHENILTPEQRKHPSETAMDDQEFDVVLTATNQEELYDEIMKKIINDPFLSKIMSR